MELLLTIAQRQTVPAGAEIFTSHLKKVFPDLAILDYKTLVESAATRKSRYSLFREPLAARQLAQWLLKHYKHYSPRAVLTNGMFGWSLPPLNVPVVNIQHGTYSAFASAALKKRSFNYWRIKYIYSFFEKLSAKKNDIIIANSEYTRLNIKKYYALESRVIYNAIDTDIFKPLDKQKAREALNLPEDRKICLFVGRPDYTKGFDIVAKLAQRCTDILFLCVSFPAVASPSRNMKTFSQVGHEKLRLFYSAADWCINPSRFEGFGYVPLEALACDTPVLTSRVGIFNDMDIEGARIVGRNHADEYRPLLSHLPAHAHSHRAIKKKFSFRVFKKEYTDVIDALTT